MCDENNALRVEKAIFVELKLTKVGPGVTLSFQDVPQLRGKFIQAIEAFTDEQLTLTPDNNPLIPSGSELEFAMTFNEESLKKIENIPYISLIALQNAGILRQFKNLEININKSIVRIGGATASVGQSLGFMFYYTDRPVN